MEAQIRIGSRRSFTLKQAVLIYRDNSAAFATLHDVQGDKDRAPYLGTRTVLDDCFSEVSGAGTGLNNCARDPAGKRPGEDAGTGRLVEQGAAPGDVLRWRHEGRSGPEGARVPASSIGVQSLPTRTLRSSPGTQHPSQRGHSPQDRAVLEYGGFERP